MVTDKELASYFNHWWEHYAENGDKHYPDTKPERITELYWDQIIDRVLSDLPEMTEAENDEIVERLNKMF